MEGQYEGKWVVVLIYPNMQNDYIGKIKCFFVLKETEKMIFCSDHEDDVHWRFKAHKKEIVRIINKDDKHKIIQLYRNLHDEFHNETEAIEKKYQKKIEDIAKGDYEKSSDGDGSKRKKLSFLQSILQR